MAREDFSHIKPVVQSGGGNIQLVGQAWGSAVSATDLAGDGGGNIQPAGLFSSAPYVPPIQKEDRTGMCIGKQNTCRNTKRIRQNGLCPGCDMARMKRNKAMSG